MRRGPGGFGKTLVWWRTETAESGPRGGVVRRKTSPESSPQHSSRQAWSLFGDVEADVELFGTSGEQRAQSFLIGRPVLGLCTGGGTHHALGSWSGQWPGRHFMGSWRNVEFQQILEANITSVKKKQQTWRVESGEGVSKWITIAATPPSISLLRHKPKVLA